MKLDRVLSILAVGIALGATACGSHAASNAKPATPTAQAQGSTMKVSTTQLTAAQLDEADEAPQVGDVQQHAAAKDSLKEEGVRKDDAHSTGRIDRKHGGGFSGYK